SYPHLSIFWMIIYYVIFIYILICFAKGRRKYILLYIPIYLCLVFSLRIVNPFYKVTFIDVGQGDSILIELPHDQGNILVDSYYNTVEYLKSIGIRKLDYVILTHFDNDHMGTIEEVIKSFHVSALLYSEFENVEKLSNLSIEKIPVKSGLGFKVSKTEFHILGPINAYSDSNSNSVVLKFTFNNYSFLMTGDMTEKEENDLILKYEKELSCDVLKVGHHGSETSSSIKFLKYVNPTYSIISVSESNRYGLPSSEIVRRLSAMSKVYMTKDSGNIQVIITDKIKVNEYR
ncbi:MAG: MBL fold metallo-hydrolase, partial [Anaeroplasmataceae bacterium]|nr:MBL fold metallo-hydrolase [Anaeroplasmataceae bacterium]